AAIGSGGPFAQSAAQALADHTQLSARQIAEEAMKIASKICIYTNEKVTIEELGSCADSRPRLSCRRKSASFRKRFVELCSTGQPRAAVPTDLMAIYLPATAEEDQLAQDEL